MHGIADLRNAEICKMKKYTDVLFHTPNRNTALADVNILIQFFSNVKFI